jgi:ABC-type sugar transport system substrate-binding protein
VRRAALSLALGAVLALLASGCGGGSAATAPSENPGVFITRILGDRFLSQLAHGRCLDGTRLSSTT